MGRFGNEELTAMTVLLKQGHSQSAVARILGVNEGRFGTTGSGMHRAPLMVAAPSH